VKLITVELLSVWAAEEIDREIEDLRRGLFLPKKKREKPAKNMI
jgi:hypothetical protein